MSRRRLTQAAERVGGADIECRKGWAWDKECACRSVQTVGRPVGRLVPKWAERRGARQGMHVQGPGGLCPGDENACQCPLGGCCTKASAACVPCEQPSHARLARMPAECCAFSRQLRELIRGQSARPAAHSCCCSRPGAAGCRSSRLRLVERQDRQPVSAPRKRRWQLALATDDSRKVPRVGPAAGKREGEEGCPGRRLR